MILYRFQTVLVFNVVVINFESCKKNRFKYLFSNDEMCHFVFINIYANPNSFPAVSSSLKLSISCLTKKSTITKTGDCCALTYGNLSRCSKLKPNDTRIKRFARTKNSKKKFSIVFASIISDHLLFLFLIFAHPQNFYQHRLSFWVLNDEIQ